MYPISDTQIAIMPTLDYYGYEHEDAITGGTGCFTEQGGPGVFVEMGCGWLWVFSCGWFGVEGEGGGINVTNENGATTVAVTTTDCVYQAPEAYWVDSVIRFGLVCS
jgi:hypothetical protein